MSMACKELVELVTDYLEGMLSAEERTRFENHLVECGGCRSYIAQMQETIHLTGMLSEKDITPEAESELLRVFRDWKQQSSAED
jgi:predicted anti-sigma-YlaC factor YlaD